MSQLRERAVRLSPYNPRRLHEVGVIVNDCTLREGEQTPGMAFTVAEKIEIAEALIGAGIQHLQIGTADAPDLFPLARAVGRDRSEVLVLAFKDDWRAQIDAAIALGIGRVNVACRSSDYLLALLGWSHDQFLTRSVDAVSYAVDRGLQVTYSPTDSTRASWDLLELAFRQTVEAGASVVYVLDTVGVASPAALSDLVRRTSESVPVPVGVHVHNDLGLALANAVASCESGASWVDVCVNGLGDRCGNAALDEVVVVLELVCGAETGVDLSRLTALATLVAGICRSSLPAAKPIVGTNAFAQATEIHIEATLRDPLAYQGFLPSIVGGHSRIAVGKHSGIVGLRERLASIDRSEGSTGLSRLSRAIAETVEGTKRNLTDSELSDLADTITENRCVGN